MVIGADSWISETNSNSEFKIIQKLNDSTIFPRKSWKCTDNKEKEPVESHDRLHLQGAQHLTEKDQ